MQLPAVAALGRVGQIGDFYDVRMDSFLSGMNIFSRQPTGASLRSIDNFITDLKYVMGDSYEEKCRHLDVSAELKLSVLAGLFQLSGSGRYLNDRKSNSRTSSCTLFYNIKTMLERINIFDPSLRPNMCAEALTAAGTSATHVVTEIQYGANAFVTFESKTADNSDTTVVEGMLSVELQKIGFSISGEGQVGYRDSGLRNFNDMTFKVFGDILSDQEIPQNLEQALGYIRGLPAKAREANSGRGKPLAYGLFPIEMLRMYLQIATGQQQLIRTISESTIQSFTQLFEAVAKMKQQLQSLKEYITEFECVVEYADSVTVTKLIHDICAYETNLRNELKSSTITARKADGECSLLEELHVKIMEDPRSPNANQAKVYELNKSILESTTFATLMSKEGVQFITPMNSIENVLIAHQDCEVYILFANSVHKKQSAEWNLNQSFFIALCRNGRKGALGDVFYIHDSSSLQDGHLQFPKVKVSHYKNRKLIEDDFAVSAAVNALPVAKPGTDVQLCLSKPVKRVSLELPCPGSFTGACSSDAINWHCWKCQEVLEYGFNDFFYCNCGKSQANGFLFKCNDLENHGFGYEVFNPAKLLLLLFKMKPLKEINILILGETGVGKSTWINGFVNYLTYPSLSIAAENEDVSLIPSSFTMTNENGQSIQVKSKTKSINESAFEGQSATQYPKSYVFPYGDALIRIVDTPGIADTRGVEQDKKNFENIMHHISYLPEIHGICILLKPQESRTSILFQFCVKELLTQLHKDAVDNIIFCFTNARSNFYRPGNTKPTLEAVLSKNNGIGLTLSDRTMYCVDNESVRFLAAVHSGVVFSQEETDIYEGSWQKSVAETNRLLAHIHVLKPHCTQSTTSVNRARKLILDLTEPIGRIAKNIEENIAAVQAFEEEIKKSLTQREGYLVDLNIPKVDFVEVETGHPTTVCASLKCSKSYKNPGEKETTVEYTQRCHEPCNLAVPTGIYPQVGLKKCRVMNLSTGRCRVCGCKWNFHLHITHMLKRVRTTVVNPVVEEMLNATDSRVEKVRLKLEETGQRILALKMERNCIAEISSKFAAFLKVNAIAPYNDQLINYLKHLINLEKAKVEHGVENRVLIGYEDMLRVYQENVKTLDRAIRETKAEVLQPQEIEQQIDALFSLPNLGDQLKTLVEAANAGANRNMAFNEQTYIPKRCRDGVSGPPKKKVQWQNILQF